MPFFTNGMNCIFCKIIKGEIPANKIYEDENFLAFLDINPVKKGHTLIIPKTHITWMHEADDSVIEKTFVLTKKMMKHFIEKLPCDYVQVVVVGHDVPHFHVHIIPRSLKDDVAKNFKPLEKYNSEEEKKEIQDKIKM